MKVSNCCGAEAVKLFSEKTGRAIYVCKKCIKDCTPVEKREVGNMEVRKK